MAKNYHHSHKGLALFCVILALMLISGLTLGGLELWGKDDIKPSNWGKSNLAPVTITLTEKTAHEKTAQIFESGARAYALAAASAASYPSTKRATATCTLPEGGSPERYEWQITDGEGLTVKTVNSNGSAADITAQKFFPGTATLTARAYRGNELRGIGSISIRAREPEPEPEPLPALSLSLFSLHNQNAHYQHDLDAFKNEVLPVTAENVDLEEITIMETNTEAINENFSKHTGSEADLIVIFDNYGIIVNAMDTMSFDLLSENSIPFLVIDEDAYAAEKVEAAGGYYLTANGYDVNDARTALDEWNTYRQEIALKYHEPNASETAFDVFIDELFEGTAQEFYENELENLYSQYAYEYDIIICVLDNTVIQKCVQFLDAVGYNAEQITWIVGDYYCGKGNEPQEQFYTDYPNIGNAIVYQRQLNERNIIKAITSLVNGEEISEIFAYEHIRIL